MAYERQYYTNGDVLDARQMNHMETGIKENSDNIDKLSEDIATKASAIKEKASGEVIVTTDSDEAKPLGLAIDGKSEQNQYSGKNLLPNVGKTQTINGVTFTVNEDGSVTANGTATANTSFYIISKYAYGGMFLPVGSYVLSGCPSGGSDTTYRLQIYGLTESGGMAYDFGNGVSMEFANENADYNVVVFISSGYTANKLRFYPMISLDGGDYEPYCGGKPSPSPEYKQEIRNIGVYDEASGKYAVEVKCTGKNLLKNNAVSKTESGITITVDDDGVITVNGTSTAIVWVAIKDNFSFNGGLHYILSGCPVGGSNATYFVYANGYTMNDNGKGVDIIYDENTTTNIGLCIRNGVTVSNLTFKPMLRHAEITDGTYEPYKETTAKVLLDEPLRKGDKVYWNGGSKVRIDRYRDVEVFDGSENWKKSNATGRYGVEIADIKNIAENDTPILLSDRYIAIIGDKYKNYTHGISSAVSTIYVTNNELQTIEEFKTALAENPITVEYERATPITEEIDIDLGELSMFYPTTIISNDCNANMEVTYIADTKAYIDKKFAELATAMV